MSEPASKRAKFEDQASEISEASKVKLKEVDSVQVEIDTLNEKASDEILKVEQKYNTLRRPIFEKRAKAIQKLPHFWLTTLINHPQISTMIDEDEEELLSNLKSIEVEENEDLKSGFKIIFTFDENEFFENDHFIKEYILGGDEQNVKSTKIRWKGGKKNGKDDNQSLSFFGWLTTDLDPSADDLAELIKDDIWPNPLQYFLAPELDDGDDGGEQQDNISDLEEIDEDGEEAE